MTLAACEFNQSNHLSILIDCVYVTVNKNVRYDTWSKEHNVDTVDLEEQLQRPRKCLHVFSLSQQRNP